MTVKVIDLEARKERHIHKRKEARVDAMRNAFRLAREGGEAAAPGETDKNAKARKAKRAKSRRSKKK